jgi:2-hydroxychromene-2-carboxylate isomerase
MTAAAAAVAAALAAGSGAAVASTTGAKPGAPAKTTSASEKPGGSKAAAGSKAAEERQGHDAITAAVARELHVSTARVSAALRPLFAAGGADSSSPVFSAAARSLGVSAQQLYAALGHAKQSLAAGTRAMQSPGGSKAAVGSKAAEERQGHDAITAAVARELHVSTARVSAALRPLFAAGGADSSSPVFSAAARSLGVSAQQLSAAVGHAKQSLAAGN